MTFRQFDHVVPDPLQPMGVKNKDQGIQRFNCSLALLNLNPPLTNSNGQDIGDLDFKEDRGQPSEFFNRF